MLIRDLGERDSYYNFKAGDEAYNNLRTDSYQTLIDEINRRGAPVQKIISYPVAVESSDRGENAAINITSPAWHLGKKCKNIARYITRNKIPQR